ncbi:hypothetical protein AB0J52_00255 [Spirillospora sp. NPDC049652]
MIELLLLGAGGFAGGVHAVRKHQAQYGPRSPRRRSPRTDSLLVKAWNASGAPTTDETMLADALAELGGRVVGSGARGAWKKGKAAKPWAEARWQQREANGGTATFFRRRQPTRSGAAGPTLQGRVVPPSGAGVQPPGSAGPSGTRTPGPSVKPPGGPNGSPAGSTPASPSASGAGSAAGRGGAENPATGSNRVRPVPAVPGCSPATGPTGAPPVVPGQPGGPSGGGGTAASRPATRHEAERLVPTGRRRTGRARRPQRAQTRMRVLGPLLLDVPDTDAEFLDTAAELMQILRGIAVAVEDWTDQVAIRNLPPIVVRPLYLAAEGLVDASACAAMATVAFEVWFAEAREVADAGIEFTGDDPA